MSHFFRQRRKIYLVLVIIFFLSFYNVENKVPKISLIFNPPNRGCIIY